MSVHVADSEEQLVHNVTALLLRELHHSGEVVKQLTSTGPAQGHKRDCFAEGSLKCVHVLAHSSNTRKWNVGDSKWSWR